MRRGRSCEDFPFVPFEGRVTVVDTATVVKVSEVLDVEGCVDVAGGVVPGCWRCAVSTVPGETVGRWTYDGELEGSVEAIITVVVLVP